MAEEETSPFKAEVKVEFKQVIIGLIVLLLVVSIPFVVSYIQNPDKRSFSDLLEVTMESFKLTGVTEEDTPFTITLPVINKTIDLTILKKNPQLLMYGGIIILIIAMLIGISLIRNLLRKGKNKNAFEQSQF